MIINSISKKIKAHSAIIWNALGSTMYGANSVLLLVAVNRVIGVDAAGMFSIAFTTAQLLWIVGIFGVSDYQMTDYKEKYCFHEYVGAKVFSCIVMFVVSFITCFALGFGFQKSVLTLIVSVYMMAHAVSELFQNRMFQKNRLDLSGKSMFFRTFFSLVCFVLTLYVTHNVFFATVILALGNIVSIWFFSFFLCRPFIPQHCNKSKPEVKSLVFECFPLFISLLLMNILLQLPKYPIESYCNDEVQGVFGMLFLPAQFINLISSFIFRPILKDLSKYYYSGDVHNTLKLVLRLILLTILFTVICNCGAWLCGTEFLSLLYGIDLSCYRYCLVIIISGGGIFACCQLMYYLVVIMRKQKFIFLNYIICTVAFMFICPIIVKKYGINGASVSFVISHLTLAVGYILIIIFSLKKDKQLNADFQRGIF